MARLSLGVLLLSFGALAASEAPLPVVVQVDPALAGSLEVQPLREAVASELGAPLAPEDFTGATLGRLEVLALDERTARLVWHHQGTSASRLIHLDPADPLTARDVALLVGTLARDEVGALIAPAAPGSAARPPESPPARRVILGVEALASSVPAVKGVSLFAGVRLGVRVAPWLTLGLTQVGAWSAGRTSVSFAPYGELSLHWPDDAPAPVRFEPFAQVGAVVQIRFGAGLAPSEGVAPFLGGGARVWFGDRFGVGLLGRALAVASQSLQVLIIPNDRSALPQGAISLSGGLELLVRP